MRLVIHIVKDKAPKEMVEELASLRSTPDASVDWGELKNREPIRESLCREQGNLCAYCMRRISADASHVEHIVPQSMCKPGQDVDYNNMLAVCDGNENAGNEKGLTCDRHRRNTPLTVNPLKPETLENIAYRSNGLIYSTDESIHVDLVDTLNLNCEAAYLPENRKAVMAEFNKWLSCAAQRGNAAGACKRRRKKIEKSENKPEFAGVLLYLLDKRIRQGR